MSEITVRFPTVDLTLSNIDTGVAAILQDLDRWYDSAAPRRNDEDIPDADGIYDEEPIYDDARRFAVVGEIISAFESDVYEVHEKLMALKADNLPFPVIVTDEHYGALTVTGKLSGPILFPIEEILDAGIATFTIPIVAADPAKYGPTVTVTTGPPTGGGGLDLEPIVFPIDFGAPGDPGRITLTNTGDRTTWPTLIVKGGLSGGFELVVIETGEIIRLDRLIPDTSEILIDVVHAQAWIDNQSPVVMTRANWFNIPPHSSRTIQFNPLGVQSGAPTLTGIYAPANQ